jgi:hypothetical protein
VTLRSCVGNDEEDADVDREPRIPVGEGFDDDSTEEAGSRYALGISTDSDRDFSSRDSADIIQSAGGVFYLL